jgi:hypothetical protein
MISIGLSPAEFAAVELPCDDTLTSLTLSTSGKLVADVQASPCGLTWASPCASARLDTERRTLLLGGQLKVYRAWAAESVPARAL